MPSQIQSLNKSQPAKTPPSFSQIAAEKLLQRRRTQNSAERRFIDYLPLVSPLDWRFDTRHLAYICDHLDQMRRGEFDRLAIFLPPRHGKSENVTVRFPVYL